LVVDRKTSLANDKVDDSKEIFIEAVGLSTYSTSPPTVDVIFRNAFRIQKLTKDILDVTRIESHTLKLNKTRVNLKDVILNAMEDTKLKPMPECSNKVRLEFKNRDRDNAGDLVSHSDIFVQADTDRITQVISNLLNNALKFTCDGLVSGGIARKIDKKEGPEKQEVAVVSIEDTGSGIDPEIYPRLFPASPLVELD
jgi:two-component system, OmpR family, sensor histidine kinase VicK